MIFIIVLLIIFLFICLSMTRTLENFDNNESQNNNKKENQNKENNNEENKICDKEDIIEEDGPIKYLKLHPTSEEDTNKKKIIDLKTDVKKIILPINITLIHNISKNDCSENRKFPNRVCQIPKESSRTISERCPTDYVTGTVTNNFITTGYGAKSSLGSSPV